jgi:hypothetical protein
MRSRGPNAQTKTRLNESIAKAETMLPMDNKPTKRNASNNVMSSAR